MNKDDVIKELLKYSNKITVDEFQFFCIAAIDKCLDWNNDLIKYVKENIIYAR